MAVNRLRNIDEIVTQSGTVVAMDDVVLEGTQVTDSAKLNGQAASYYATASALSGKLGTTQKAADANKLDGLDSTAFLRSNGKAADSNLLDGLDSTAFLRSTAKAADSAKLNGQAASYYATAGHGHTEFAPNTGLTATTDGSTALGWTGTQFKAVPVGVSVITKRTGSDGAIEFVLPTA